MEFNCQSSYLDNEETIINKKCAVILEFKYFDNKNTSDDNSPYVQIKFGISASINTQANVILKSVQLLEKSDCPCCNITCEEDNSLPMVTTSMCLNADCSQNTSEKQEINTISLDQEIVYDFKIVNKVRRNLGDNVLTLGNVYAQDDNYALQLNDEIKIQTTDTSMQLLVNASSIAFDLGKKFHLKMIFKESNSSDSDIPLIKVRIVDSPMINIKSIQITKNSDDGAQQIILIVVFCALGVFAVIIVIIYIKKKKKYQKYQNTNLQSQTVDDNTEGQKNTLSSQIVNDQTRLNQNSQK